MINRSLRNFSRQNVRKHMEVYRSCQSSKRAGLTPFPVPLHPFCSFLCYHCYTLKAISKVEYGSVIELERRRERERFAEAELDWDTHKQRGRERHKQRDRDLQFWLIWVSIGEEVGQQELGDRVHKTDERIGSGIVTDLRRDWLRKWRKDWLKNWCGDWHSDWHRDWGRVVSKTQS